MTRSALQKCQLDHNSWPHFISAIQTEPGKLNCPNCETPTDDPVLTYSSQAKFVFIEFSPELMDLINLCENMHVGSINPNKELFWANNIPDIKQSLHRKCF